MVEHIKLNLIYLLFPLTALVLMLWQVNYGLAAQFNNTFAKVISPIVLVLAGVSIHLLQGPFKNFVNLLTIATAFYFVANFLPNYDMGYPAFRDAGNSADLAAADVAKISARFLFLTLGLFTVLYVFFAIAGSDISFLPTAKNAYRRIVMMETPMM